MDYFSKPLESRINNNEWKHYTAYAIFVLSDYAFYFEHYKIISIIHRSNDICRMKSIVNDIYANME